MKFSIDKKVLQNNLTYVAKAISFKTPIPALSGIKFELTDDELILLGSSLETSIKTIIPKKIDDKEIIEIEETGSIILNANFILDIVKKVEDDKIKFEILDGNLIKITTSISTFNLNGISAEEYPSIDIDKSEDTFTISKSLLNTIINETVFAISKNESRIILTGVNFKCVGNVISINATDSYRLSYKTVTHNDDLNCEFIIPGKILVDLNTICIGDGDVIVHVFNNKVMFEFDNVLFQTKLLEGTYPDTQKLIPQEFNTEILVKTRNIVSAIDRASILSRDKTKNVVKLELASTNALISSKSPEIGRVEETLDVEYLKAGSFDISYSARFVKEAINSLNCDEVVIKFNGDMKPFIIVNPNDNTIVQLVLPVRTY